jgi:hypothetical protein
VFLSLPILSESCDLRFSTHSSRCSIIDNPTSLYPWSEGLFPKRFQIA